MSHRIGIIEKEQATTREEKKINRFVSFFCSNIFSLVDFKKKKISIQWKIYLF
jgi:hypothetical protein